MIGSTPFDLARPPVDGLTVLEASAGTGKTFSLAGITVLGLAAGRVATRQICVVTFTEPATAELTGRLRRRLSLAVELLGRWQPGDDVPTDPVDRLLLDGDDGERAERLRRLTEAVADFDAVSISTIHGFCQRLLTATGHVAVDVGGADADVDEVVRDHLVAHHLDQFDPGRVVDAVRKRLAMPDAAMATFPSVGGAFRPVIDRVVEAVEACVRKVEDRRTEWRRRTFDSMITDARNLLLDPVRGRAIVAELRDRFRLVLIDEFQDTDGVQWDLFRTAFLDPSLPADIACVVVVGDPKQSIYRFRGAELSAYLAAVEYARTTGGALHSLDTNWRSDAALLTALETFLSGATFGDPSVTFHPVTAGRGDDGRRLADPQSEAALVVRAMHPPVNAKGIAAAPAAHDWTRSDLVAEVVRLLDTVTIVRHAGGDAEPLRPSDIGVLVRSNDQASDIADRLRIAGVPVVVSSEDSVLDSAAAMHWTTLIDALQRPTRIAGARAVALGVFGSLDAARIAGLDATGETELLEQLRGYNAALARGGVPHLVAALRCAGYPERVLARSGGERLLTDLDHIAELLQRVTGGRPCTPGRLSTALDEMRLQPKDSASRDLLGRRLDRDDETVKVMTIHKAKGLEFPVVLCPTIWSSTGGGKQPLPHAHDPSAGQRLLDSFWTTGASRDDADDPALLAIRQLDRIEGESEATRLLYVALTRAVHRLVVWEVPAHQSGTQPWRDLIDRTCGRDFDAVAAGSGGCIGVHHVHTQPGPVTYGGIAPADTPLDAAEFGRDLTSDWRVWSFSGIERAVDESAHAGDSGYHTEQPPIVVGGTDEPPEETLLNVRGSAAFGTLVHAVLEETDFTSPTLDADLLTTCAAAMAHRSMPIAPQALATGLADAVRSPLGGPFGELRLADLGPADRLDELEFHLPLAACSALDLAGVVAAGLPADDPMLPWFRAAADGALDVDVEGMLTGSIDLVGRVGDRHFVADYKTNRIAPDATFTHDEMVLEMHRQSYPLQAVLYLVALRRYLSVRRPDLDPAHAVVGAGYLFVRGMTPSADPADARGVLWWTPPAEMLADLDALVRTGARP